MRLLRGIALALAALLMLAMVPLALAAYAQSDVEEAADDATRARGELSASERAIEQARHEIGDLASLRNEVQEELLSTLALYEQRNSELAEVSYVVAGLRDRVVATEQSVVDLRSAVREQAVTAYIVASVPTHAMVWSADNLHSAFLLTQTIELTSQRDIGHLDRLATTRKQLGTLRGTFEAEQQRLLVIRNELEQASHSLESEFEIVDASLAAAYRDMSQADRRYQQAITDSEAAERRLAAFRGAGEWKPLVERYFPPSLVEQALYVIDCESGGNADAHNVITGAGGLFQFLPGTWAIASARAGFGGASRFDPEANIASAAWLVKQSIATDHPRGAWGHWSCRP